MKPALSIWALLTHRKIFILFLLGFASGLPMILIGSTLAAWCTQAGLSLVIIGSLSVLRQPYAYKVAWAPLCDVFKFPFLDLRRGWLLVTQIGCTFFLILMSFFNPQTQLTPLIISGLLVALFSATQDIASSAYLADTCNHEPALRGLGASSYTAGYRVALITGGALALIFAQHIGWQFTYFLMSSFMIIGMVATYYAPASPNSLSDTSLSFRTAFKKLKLSLSEPLQRFSPKTMMLIITTIFFYKLGDAFTVILNTPFLYELGFTMHEIALALKTMGMAATILGGIVGGTIMYRLTLFRALVYFGAIQALCNLSYYWLALVGHDYTLMIISIFIEYFSSGLGTAAFMSLIMYLCNPKYSATQYAFWSAIGALGSIFCGPLAGYLVHHLGWAQFYIICFLIGLPGIGLLFLIHPHLKENPKTTC